MSAPRSIDGIVRWKDALRILRRCEIDDAGCWIYHGHLVGGYGQTAIGSTADGTRMFHPTHRIVYTVLAGPIPDGLYTDHLCRNTACQNPDHLEPVTPQQNTLRGTSFAAQHAARTTCPKGHPYDKIDTYGRRRCARCDAARKREWYLAKKRDRQLA